MTSKVLGPINNQSLADQARDLIREAIFNGKIKPEERADHRADRGGIRHQPDAREGSAQGARNRRDRAYRAASGCRGPALRQRMSFTTAIRSAHCSKGTPASLPASVNALAVATDLERNCAELKKALTSARADDLDTIQVLVELNLQFHERILAASGSAHRAAHAGDAAHAVCLPSVQLARSAASDRFTGFSSPDRASVSRHAAQAGPPPHGRRTCSKHDDYPHRRQR